MRKLRRPTSCRRSVATMHATRLLSVKTLWCVAASAAATPTPTTTPATCAGDSDERPTGSPLASVNIQAGRSTAMLCFAQPGIACTRRTHVAATSRCHVVDGLPCSGASPCETFA